MLRVWRAALLGLPGGEQGRGDGFERFARSDKGFFFCFSHCLSSLLLFVYCHLALNKFNLGLHIQSWEDRSSFGDNLSFCWEIIKLKIG